MPVAVSGQQLWIVALYNLDHSANVIDDIVRQSLLHGLRPARAGAGAPRVAPRATDRSLQPDVRIVDPAIPAERSRSRPP